tara:strand:- start:218 stop:919 length:702 start_codon:yes stop_codon:yes gene_type:complete
MTKLYENNSYLKEFETIIEDINKEENLIKLKDTAFYGKGGGQPGDTGEIIINDERIAVLETIKKNNNIFHKMEKINNIKINETVKGIINWQKRYKYMRMHSSLHLMCSIIPMDVTGGQIGYDKSRLDFNDQEKKIKKDEIEEKLNLLVNENHIITSELIDSKILKEKPEIVRTMSVKPPEIDGKIRLIKIGNIDLQPCGGTHVKSTIEIGKIKISKIENKGKMNRRVSIVLND